MLMNIKNYDGKVKELESSIQTVNSRVTTVNTNLTSSIQSVNTNLTASIQTTNNRVTALDTELAKVGNLAYNHLCYTAVISIAQSGNYVFESPFLRAIIIGQINNFVHVIHISREGVYSAAEGFKTENMTLMRVTGTANGIVINNLNADNVLRVFVLFK